MEIIEIKQNIKVCKVCKLTLPISAFRKNKHIVKNKIIISHGLTCIECLRKKHGRMSMEQYNEIRRNANKNNAEKVKKTKEIRKQEYIKNSDKIKQNERNRANKIDKCGLKVARINHLKSHYNMTPDEYKIMLCNQENKCAICNTPFIDSDKKPNVDHCHVSGKVRGILCTYCNHGLGNFKDNINIMEKAIEYIIMSEMNDIILPA